MRRLSLSSSVTGAVLIASALLVSGADASPDLKFDDDDFIKAFGNKLVQPKTGNRYMFSGASMAAGNMSDLSPAEFFGTIETRGHNLGRLWLFNHSKSHWGIPVLHTGPGEFHQDGFARIDEYIAQAEKHGMRIIYTLEGNWIHTPGIPFIVLWSETARAQLEQHRVTWEADEQVVYNEAFDYQRIEPDMSLEMRQSLIARGYALQSANPADQSRMQTDVAVTVVVPAGTQVDSAKSIRCLNGPGLCRHNIFWGDELCKQYFKEYLDTVLNHTNKITGRRYKDEPAILCWELMNEGRNRDTGDGKTSIDRVKETYEWYKEMSDYIAARDTNHLISTGESGALHFGTDGDAAASVYDEEFPDAGIPVMDDYRERRDELVATLSPAAQDAWPYVWWVNIGTIIDGTDWYANHTNSNITLSSFHYFEPHSEFMILVSKRDLDKPLYVGEYDWEGEDEAREKYDLARRMDVDGLIMWFWNPMAEQQHSEYVAWQKSKMVPITPDTSPPLVTVVGPSGSIRTTDAPLVVTTDEAALVRWSLRDVPYNEMENQFTRGERTSQHSTTVPVVPGTYTVYVRALDLADNVTGQSKEITFTVLTNGVLVAPVTGLTGQIPDGGTYPDHAGAQTDVAEGSRDLSAAAEFSIKLKPSSGISLGEGDLTALIVLFTTDNYNWVATGLVVTLTEGEWNDVAVRKSALPAGSDLSDVRTISVVFSTTESLHWSGNMLIDNFLVTDASGQTLLSDDFEGDGKLPWKISFVSAASVLTELNPGLEHELDGAPVLPGVSRHVLLDAVYCTLVGHDGIAVSFSRPGTEPVSVKLLNVSGRLISESTPARSKTTVRLNAPELSAGVYLVSVSVGQRRYTRRVVVGR